MLVLTRKVDEEIVIADNIRICVVGIQNGKVQLGVSAPREIPVHRSEIHDRIQFEQTTNSRGGSTVSGGSIAVGSIAR
ncbi:MAG: carbon storage regulator CsrA [Planctomycetaceae bacterium]|jgi:carbon storage regulator|nr:carbon storage regulator CsrA [Planctomycetaceae bacterium]MBT6156721.1 carbon storage regulator CsrA [Planctomycetaceae bacterium]MBT6486012.1 carbon storage regulator CsrA [Planctomycetaceae bacterium]MBT6493128.1 carbon storage regulator CsrA [Planctomycetaceae bacterium]